MQLTYQQFLESKMVIAPESGFDVDPEDIDCALKPHQQWYRSYSQPWNNGYSHPVTHWAPLPPPWKEE